MPCVLAYIILHYKSIRAKDWFTAIGLGLYPSAMYLSYNWINTGSPFFPFYNAIFQSPYYPIVNYGDPRWGGANLFEKLFWIIYTAFKPSYRQCEISDLRPAVLIVGLIGTLGLIIIFFTQRIRKKETIPVKYILLISLAISFTLLWSFSIGYGRYFIFGKVLWGILAFCFVMEMVNRYKVWGKIIASISAIFTIVCFGMNLQSSLAGAQLVMDRIS